MIPACVCLEDGATFHGLSPAWMGDAEVSGVGEVVFTTAMVGYVESLTDPSFAGQILVFSYPLIGNYGVPPASSWESSKPWVKGAVFGSIAPSFSHWEATQSIQSWLAAYEIPWVSGVDTRALVRKIRTQGSPWGALTRTPSKPLIDPQAMQDIVSVVSSGTIIERGAGEKTVIVVDCGIKENIIRSLMRYPIKIKQVPWNYDYSAEDFDGVLLSNGPGDPAQCAPTIAILKKAMARGKPIFGICLGAQLLALSAGAKTVAMHFGHRGINQPCLHLPSHRAYLTSQNHGYKIVEDSLPAGWRVSFRNLNDGSVEGIAHESLPFFAVQFHPEANPGPWDTQWLFEKFVSNL